MNKCDVYDIFIIIIINVEKTSDALLSLQTVIMQVNYLAYVYR